MLLDEPTLGLDVEASAALVAALRQKAAHGCTVLMTTHNMALAEELSERVVFLHSGKVVMDGPLDLLLNQGLKEVYLHVIGQARNGSTDVGS